MLKTLASLYTPAANTLNLKFIYICDLNDGT